MINYNRISPIKADDCHGIRDRRNCGNIMAWLIHFCVCEDTTAEYV